ncbi:hypothetical protein M752DRAFT_99874 [Aspergillus phoenicis ATCC 13157]|uniref:Uncharacterized protein n=1 Tax=Aspergillus phoenicis ATCC 13157 TaxID=1353007 RepID=A0A370PVQ5_ASPPH|nr:hypothetical protein M752DRAFT_99874 [Aspergillus phoenicis ATCC 13157]
MNSSHAFSSRSATFSCAVTGYIRSTYQADQQVLTDPWFAHLFFCQPIFIGDDAVLFRDPDPERRPITPRYFNPAFSGLRVSASRVSNQASSVLLLILLGGPVQCAVGIAIIIFSIARYTVLQG